MVYEKMCLQENTFKLKVTQNVAQYPLHHVNYAASLKFDVSMSIGLGKDTRNEMDNGPTLVQNWMTDRFWYEINIAYTKNRV